MEPEISIHRDMIQRAKAGDKKAERFLRLRIASTSKGMPLDLLLATSALIVAYRKKELKREAERN